MQWTAIAKHADSNRSFGTAILAWEQVTGFLDDKKVFAPGRRSLNSGAPPELPGLNRDAKRVTYRGTSLSYHQENPDG